MANICLPASTPTSSRSTISPPPARPTRRRSTPASSSYFGFTQNDPAAANITAAQMDNFMTTVVEPQFLGAGWQGTWSNATDQGITRASRSTRRRRPRSAPTTTACASSPWRPPLVTDLFDPATSAQRPQGAVLSRARQPGRRSASRDLANLSVQTGIVENRVKNASDRINMQVDLFERNIHRSGRRRPVRGLDARRDTAAADRNFLRADCAHPATQPCEIT